MRNKVRALINRRRLWLLALPVIAIGSVVAATTAWNDDEPTAEPRARILPVEVMTLGPVEEATATRFYSGAVAARRTSRLGFERAARVVSVAVDEGDAVRRGQRLASLDIRDLQLLRVQVTAQRDEAAARLEELESGPRTEVIAAARAHRDELAGRRKLAESRLHRRAELLERGAISKEEYDVVSFETGSLRAAEEAAVHQLEELEAGTRRERILTQRAVVDQLAARLAAIDLDLEKSVLRAPYTGYVSERLIDEGTVVDPGRPVLAIVEDLAPEVRVGVPSEVARTFEPGEQHPITVEDRQWEARVVSRLPELDPRTRTITVLFRLPSEAAADVVPGQVARLEMSRPLDVSGHWLPTGALTQGVRGLWACYALEPAPEAGDGVFQLSRRDVESLYTAGDQVLVRGTLAPGDRIVSSGVNRIAPGQLVRPASE